MRKFFARLWGAITFRAYRQRRAARLAAKKFNKELDQLSESVRRSTRRFMEQIGQSRARRKAPMDTIKLVNAEERPYQPTAQDAALIREQSKVQFEYSKPSQKTVKALTAHNDKFSKRRYN